MTLEKAKKAVGYTAAEFVENGMIVGLGTGSTAAYFIERLAQRCKEGLSIKVVCSSVASSELAKREGLHPHDINKISVIDLTVDGADEIDEQKRMIKGGGGACVREKIVATMSREMVVIIDETKIVTHLGARKLPVEIIPFAHPVTVNHLKKIGYEGQWRKKTDGSLFLTDNGNYLFDVTLSNPCTDPEKVHLEILKTPGVLDTGFFFNLAGRVVIGFSDGQIVIRP